MTGPVIRTPKAAAFADLWYETRAQLAQPFPTKEEMPLRKLAPFMSHMALICIDADDRAKYLLFGTAISSLIGVDLTGHYLDQAMDPGAVAQMRDGLAAFRDEYGQDARRGRWAVTHAETTGGRLVEYEDVSLPYVLPETGEVRMMTYLSVLEPMKHGEKFVKRFASHDITWFNAADARPDWLYLRATAAA
ncbi:MAG: hypothetical protein COA62_00365 [Rhodobiaceae bacterium]|nr:MAG: hypothetical protein COA62_00365 [Rhodobiaceae bacterium]